MRVFYDTVATLVSLLVAYAQEPRRKFSILSTIHISSDAPGTRHAETWLAVNPRNPQNRIVAAMTLAPSGGFVVYALTPSGKSLRAGKTRGRERTTHVGGGAELCVE